MRIAIIGAGGYVGLANAVGFALLGHRVLGIEVHPRKLERLRKGLATFDEPNALLRPIGSGLRDALASGRLEFSADDSDADSAECVMVCVGTPPSPTGDLDFGALFKLMEEHGARWLRAGTPVLIRSTVTPQAVTALEARFKGPLIIHPEFLREGRTLEDFLSPWMLVWGGPRSDLIPDLYPGLPERVPVFEMSRLEASLLKLAWNAFSSLRIAFMLGLSLICDELGCDPAKLQPALAQLPAVFGFPRPGFAFGGPCLPKDTRALSQFASLRQLLSAALAVNDEVFDRLISKLEAGGLSGSDLVGIYGLVFKPGTDDLRESPSLGLISRLRLRGFPNVIAYDPYLDSERLAETLGTALEFDLAPDFRSFLSRKPSAVIFALPPTDQDKAELENFPGLILDPWRTGLIWMVEKYWTWGLRS